MTENLQIGKLLCLVGLLICLQPTVCLCAQSVKVIFDTDISSDVDDVGAVAVLHALADQGKAEILGMMVSSGDPWSAPCLDALNGWFGKFDIPVGVVSGTTIRHESRYTETIARQYPGTPANKKAFRNATNLYRKLLAESNDQSVTIIAVGYLTNLRNLLYSNPDKNSPLNGLELIKKKVKHVVCMGGMFPTGKEWNFNQDRESAQAVLNNWPTQLIFCGYEVGEKILTGAGLEDVQKDSPIRLSYKLYNNLTDRSSWDQVTVAFALLYGRQHDEPFWYVRKGTNTVLSDGSNKWHKTVTQRKSHSYVVQKATDAELKNFIEKLMKYPE